MAFVHLDKNTANDPALLVFVDGMVVEKLRVCPPVFLLQCIELLLALGQMVTHPSELLPYHRLEETCQRTIYFV